MNDLLDSIRALVNKHDFSGVISIEAKDTDVSQPNGYRDRVCALLNDTHTRFSIASGTKGFTALGIAKLIEENILSFDSSVKKILGHQLENVHADITIHQLLGHTSGVGDYLDEEKSDDINEIILDIPVQDLVSPFDYFPLIAREKQKFQPGAKFSYSNSGYILLAAIIEKVTDQTFQDYIQDHIFDLAGMNDSGFFRGDELPSNTALGYLSGKRQGQTNIFNLPIIGNGDGGAYSTAKDMKLFWHAFNADKFVSKEIRSKLTHAKSYIKEEDIWYGLGFWINKNHDEIALEGYDAGVSFRSAISQTNEYQYTFLSNTSSGVWPFVHFINEKSPRV